MTQALFWAAPRRAPQPLDFDAKDPLHYSFVYNFALLWAGVWKIDIANIEAPEVISVRS